MTNDVPLAGDVLDHALALQDLQGGQHARCAGPLASSAGVRVPPLPGLGKEFDGTVEQMTAWASGFDAFQLAAG